MQTRGGVEAHGNFVGQREVWGCGGGRNGVGEEGSRCLVKQKCETLFILMLSLNQQHPSKGPSRTKAGATRQAAQGPNKNQCSHIRAVGEALCVSDSQSLF